MFKNIVIKFEEKHKASSHSSVNSNFSVNTSPALLTLCGSERPRKMKFSIHFTFYNQTCFSRISCLHRGCLRENLQGLLSFSTYDYICLEYRVQQVKPHNTEENISRADSRFECTPLIEKIGKELGNERLPRTYSERCKTMNFKIQYGQKCSIGKGRNFFYRS